MTTATRTSAKLQSDELKDAYRVWLKDLHDDKPERLLRKLDKKKSDGGRRARRHQRMQHAQQHTAVSALKDVALKKAEREKLPTISLVRTVTDKQVLQDAQNRRHQVLVDEANYSAFQYSHQPSWRPGLAFFQQLVRHLLQKASPETGSGNISAEGVVMAELPDFPVLVAPILLRVPIRKGKRLGVALLFCQEQNQDQVVETNGGITSFILRCRVYLRASSWREHRNALLDIMSNSSAEICAVRKCAENFESRNNDLLLLRSRKEVEQAMDELWINTSSFDDAGTNNYIDLLAIQKYIPFKGSSSRNNAFSSFTSTTPSAERKAWIARCGSRKRDKNSSTAWIISGGDAGDSEDLSSTAFTNSSSAECQLVKCTIDQAWSEPRLLASMCALPLEKVLRIRFNELVVDLLQDSSGCWWLLQVKAFTLASTRPMSAATVSSLSSTKTSCLSRTQSAPTRFEVGVIPTPQWKKWRCAGRYCVTKNSMKNSSEPTNEQIENDVDGTDDDKEPCGYLTKKMLRSCEFYDDFIQQQDMSLAGGFTEFRSALTFHLQHRLPKRDRSQLYEPQSLCSACLKRYHTLRQQWIETLEAPKPISTSSTMAGHRRKSTHDKTHSEHTEQILLPPRKLPSLHHESVILSALHGTNSTPAFPTSTIANSSSKQEDNTFISKQLTYLDELAAMEEMLEEHESHSILSKTKNKVQSPAQVLTTIATSLSPLTTLPTKLSGQDDIFPTWDGVSRIEEMWQNLTFKPLERQLTNPGVTTNADGGIKQCYNSISLQQELTKVAKEGGNNKENGEHTCTTSEPQFHNEEKLPAKNVYTVHVQHCRRVFEDENYRENLVNEVLNALGTGNPNVCFVVTPYNRNSDSTHNKQHTGEDEIELAEMALRSLYIDVKQAIAALSDDLPSNLSLSSWPMRPKLCRETSGCITVKLGPA